MRLSYRNERNARAIAALWNKPLDRPDFFEVRNSAEEAEILIFDYIGWPFNDPADLVRSLGELGGKPVIARINSPGGDVFDGIAIYNALRSYGGRVTTRVESLAASSASLIALAGREVQAHKGSMIMIHEPWVNAVGNQHELREIADVLSKIADNMVEIYAERSDLGKRAIRDLLKGETWMTAKEAKEKGFVDVILDGQAAAARFDLSVFAHVPEGLEYDDSGGRELTRKETERALRNAGASREFARAVAAKRALSSDAEMKIKLLELQMKIAS